MPAKQLPLSAYALLAANIVPLVGVMFFGWSTVLVLALFWIENLIIGAFNLVKIVAASIVQRDASGFTTAPFFLLHYGIFCCGHGMLLANILGYSEISSEQVFGIQTSGPQIILLEGAAVLVTFVRDLAPAIWFGIIGLFLSRLLSFFENFILRGQILDTKVRRLMAQPYSQILIMHAGLFMGAFALAYYGSPVWMLAGIVLLKIAVDFFQFRRRHKLNGDAVEKSKNI